MWVAPRVYSRDFDVRSFTRLINLYLPSRGGGVHVSKSGVHLSKSGVYLSPPFIKGLVSLDRGSHVLYYINDSSLRVYSNVGLVVDI